MDKTYKCCLCNKTFNGYGNNPWPLCKPDDYDSRCCDDCNQLVIMARLTKCTDVDLLKNAMGVNK